MKQFYLTFLSLITILSASLSASAYDFEVDGMYFSRYFPSEVCITSGEIKYSGDINIPESVTFNNEVFKIVAVEKSAFNGCKYLKSVTIPNSVRYIGQNAFSNCSSLTYVNIPNSVISIDSYAFSSSSLAEINIPNSVTSISVGTFKYCRNLTKVTIPNSITDIGLSAFDGCSSLTEVNIPNSVTTIRMSAFAGCKNLTEVTIPNSLTVIDVGVFSGCNSLVKVTIPNSITTIGDGAFRYCGFTEVSIPNSVTTIGESAFFYCENLTEATIPNSVTTIGESAFSSCNNLTEMIIPNSVKYIGANAFSYCENLTTLFIESSDKNLFLDINSFRNTQITNLTVGRNLLDADGSDLFNLSDWGLTKISNLTILDNIGKIDFLFSNDDSYLPQTLTTLTIGENHTDYPSNLSSYKSLKTITLKDRTPQRCPEFTNLQFENVKVYVPEGSLSSYQNADGWKNFWNLSDSDESGINEIISDAIKTEVARYDLQGRQVSADYRGLIIVCYSDGSVEKVINQ